MWKNYYIETLIKKIVDNNIIISLYSEIINKENIINILSNIDDYKQFTIKSFIEEKYENLYCNKIIFISVFKSLDKYYYINIVNDIYLKKILIKNITYHEYTIKNKVISESYLFGYDIWKNDINIDFSEYINQLDWSYTLDIFYNSDSYNKIINNKNINIKKNLKTLDLEQILDIKFKDNDLKVCYFNKIISTYYYYFHYTFFIKLLNENIIVLDILEEDEMYDYYKINLNVIEYNNINEYFQTKTYDIYNKTFGNNICKIINYDYYIA